MVHKTREAEQAINDTLICASICLETAVHALDRDHSAEHIRSLLDCAELCQMTANFLLRGSPAADAVVAVCGDVARRCAESCEEVAAQDEEMGRCAEACRRTQRSCGELARTEQPASV